MTTLHTTQLNQPVEVEVMVRRTVGAPARATAAVYSVDKDDPERGRRAAKRRGHGRQRRRQRFEADAELAGLRRKA